MRHRKWTLLLTGAAAAPWLGAATNASATPLTDLQRGTAFYLDAASATLDGHSYNANAATIGKGTGTLDAMISARALGLDFDQVIHLHGTSTSAGVSWTFDESAAISLGGGYNVSRISGTLLGRVTRRYGTHPRECGGSCETSVDVTDLPGGNVTVSGTRPWGGWFTPVTEGFSKTITDFHFHVIAGMPQPHVTGVTFDVPRGTICSAMGARWFSGRVQLSDVAPTGGTDIDIVSSDPIHFPSFAVFANEGRSTAEFRVRVPSGYTGSVNIAAAGGGSVMYTPLTIEACLPPLDRKYLIDDSIHGAFSCDSCVSSIVTADNHTFVVKYNGASWLASPSHGYVSLDKTVNGTVDDVKLNAFDEIIVHSRDVAGTIAVTRVRSPWGKMQLDAIKGFEPHGIDARGDAIGVCTFGQQRLGCFESFGTFQSLASGAWTIDLVGATLGGVAVGSTATQVGIRGYRFETTGKTTTLGTLGGETHAVAVNEAGWTVGWSVANDGKPRAVVFAPGSTQPIVLATPAGYASRAIGITDDGVVVGNLDTGKVQTPILWSVANPSASQYLAKVAPTNIVAGEALSVTRFGRIVARAKRNNVDTIVVFDRAQ